MVFYGEIYPAISDFAHSTSLGQVTLSQLFHIPYGVMVLAVVIMALGMFLGAEWVEAKLAGGQPPVPPALLGKPFRLTPVRRLVVVLLAFGLLAAVGGNPYRGARVMVDTKALAMTAATDAGQIQVRELADWLVKGENDYLLLDVRDPEAFAKYHIPSAQNVPVAALDSDVAAHNEKILVYSDRDLLSAQAWFLLKAMGFPSVHVLKGGLQAWREEVLFPAKPEPATPEQLAEFNKRAEVAKFFGGKPRGAAGGGGAALPEIKAPSMSGGAALPKRSGKKHREGC
jgi:rhodanese-related sulfurtransferase